MVGVQNAMWNEQINANFITLKTQKLLGVAEPGKYLIF